MENKQKPCIYCEDYKVSKGIDLKSNCDISRSGAIIVNGDKGKELVFYNEKGTYGILINYCPMCGRKVRDSNIAFDEITLKGVTK